MPDPKKAPWEELRFNAGLLKSRIVFQILSILPNGTNDIESNTNFDELSSDEIMLPYELKSEFEKLEGKYDETGFIGKNQMAKNITIYSTDEGAEALMTFLDDACETLKQQRDRRSDKRIKQYYDDLLFISDPKNGSFTRSYLTSPYLSELFSTYATGPVVKFSSKEQKGALGEQLYNIVYDRMHAAADEFKVDYHRQQMEKEGWNVDAELTYLKELDLAHRKLINAHSELSRFTDEPQSTTQKYMGNTIKHETIGNDLIFDRSLNGTIGIMRGECQAIKNGYGSKQLMVLGALGAIEEEINRIKKHGIEGTLEGMARFEADFAKLKAECYYKDATDPLEKKEIADKIMSFIQTQSSPAAKQCMNHLSICQDSFNDAFKSVLKEAELYDIYKDMYEPARRKFNIPADMRRRFELAELKQKDPVEYLKRLEAEAKKTGDYSRFVEMLSEFKRDDLLNGDKEEKYDEYLNSLVQDYDTYEKISQVLESKYYDCISDCDKQAERIAKGIRNGAVDVDPKLEDIKTDYTISKRIANGMLINEDVQNKIIGYYNLKTALSLKSIDTYKEIAKKNEKIFLKENADGMSFIERMILKKNALEAPNNTMLTYGVSTDGHGTVTNVEPAMAFAELTNSNTNLTDYSNRIGILTAQASKKLEELTALNTGSRSPEFRRMITTLTDVTKLSNKSTPADITEKLFRLNQATVDYGRKISKHGGILNKGQKRLSLARSLSELSNKFVNEFISKGVELVAPDEPICDQLTRSINLCNSYSKKYMSKEIDPAEEAKKAQSNIKAIIENRKINKTELKKDDLMPSLSKLLTANTISSQLETDPDHKVSIGEFLHMASIQYKDAAFFDTVAQMPLEDIIEHSTTGNGKQFSLDVAKNSREINIEAQPAEIENKAELDKENIADIFETETDRLIREQAQKTIKLGK